MNGSLAASGVLNIAMLVFREGLEVRAGSRRTHCEFSWQRIAISPARRRRSRAWVCRDLGDLGRRRSNFERIERHVSALKLQAATGLLAVLVLLIVMNWFFHKLYWTSWISLHNRGKQQLVDSLARSHSKRFFAGMALLGFTSF